MTKNLTIRIPDDAEANARVDGVSLNETLKQSMVEAIEGRRQNPEFKTRLKKIIEEGERRWQVQRQALFSGPGAPSPELYDSLRILYIFTVRLS
jgi:hypothetical protein